MSTIKELSNNNSENPIQNEEKIIISSNQLELVPSETSYKSETHWKILYHKMKFIRPLKILALELYPDIFLPEFQSQYIISSEDDPYEQIFHPIPLHEVSIKINTPFCIFHPEGKPKVVWNAVLAVLLIYTATIIPFAMAFIESEPWDPWFISDLSLDLLFFIDIWVNISSAYYNLEGVLVVNRWQIFLKYLKSWMFLDLLACVPFSLIEEHYNYTEQSSENDYNSLLRLVRLPRLYRLLRISRIVKMIKHYEESEIMEKIQEFLSIKHILIRFLGIFLSILLCVHIISCFWYFLAKIDRFSTNNWVVRGNYEDESNLFLYFTSVYWAFTTLTAVGYGDIVPFTQIEKLYTLVWMFFGLFFLSFTVGSLSTMLSNIDSVENVLVNKLTFIDEFASETEISKKIKFRIRKALRYSTEKTGVSWTLKKDIFNELPKEMKYEVALAMHEGVVRELHYFWKKSKIFVAEIVPFLLPSFLEKEESVYNFGEYADEIYFIVKGRIRYDIDETLIDFVQEKSYFGDIEVTLGFERKYTAIVEKDSDLLVMNREICSLIETKYHIIWEDMKRSAELKDERYEREIIKKKLVEEREKCGKLDRLSDRQMKDEVKKRVRIQKRRENMDNLRKKNKKEITELKTREVDNKDLFELMENMYEFFGKVEEEVGNIEEKFRKLFPKTKNISKSSTYQYKSKLYSKFNKLI